MHRFASIALPSALEVLLAALVASVWLRWQPAEIGGTDDTELRVVTTAGMLRSLDPRRSRELPSLENRLIEALWDPLVRLDGPGLAAAPGVAIAWAMQPDGRTLRLHLDREARWSNGDPVTAEDFLRSLAPGGWPVRSHPLAELLETPADEAALDAAVRALDAHTLEFTAARPRPDLAVRLAIARWLPTHASAATQFELEDPLATAFVTNGPYFYAGCAQGELILRRNPHHRSPAGRPETVRAFTTNSPALYGTLIRSARAHLADQLSLSRDLVNAAGGDVVVEEEPTASISLIQFNTSRPPLANPVVRRALALALDRAELARGFAGAGAVPAYSFTPPGQTGVQPIRTVTEDLAEARRLLTEAGHPDGAGLPVLRFPVVVGEGVVNPLALLCAEQWRARLGVRVYVVPVARKELLMRAERGDFDLIHMRWTAQAFDVSLLPGQLQGQLPAPFRAWPSQRVAAAVSRADALTGEARRSALLEAERALVNEVPATPTVLYKRTTLRHRRVQGWQRDVFGLHPLRTLGLAPREETHR